MRWIISSADDIAVSRSQILARREYICDVTNSQVSDWRPFQLRLNGQTIKEFLICTSDDGINGTFITAHIGDVYALCSLPEICTGEIVVANTCIWKRLSHKELLFRMMSVNRNVSLFFAEQELSIDNYIFRQSTTLSNVGQFSFQTSLSERKLFINRGRGLMEAIRMSFIRVSPIILLGE